ncbi:hypothetical protein DSCW_07600 [Desulfosarcina widdelii]|uniref:Uncharacterized protein n=1 Tax=Desulfosarcina widdelii TaxID=947919 RepID=A0A5K7YZI3_9BACT|nr:hypothetical protein [Desulfosarcina widdelii]BBO73343.1 hypothetical protein DSCW_07600 [Desulfosarcina widdelii]
MNFSKEFKVREVGAPVAAADDTDDNSDIVDMSGYEGVVFIGTVTDSVATGVATLTAEQNSTSSDAGMAALTGATATATCTTNDDLNNKTLILDVYRPRERFVQCVRTSGTANIAFGSLLAIPYGRRTLPGSDDDSNLQTTLVVSPAEA